MIGNANSIGKDDVLYTGVPNGYTLNGSFSGIYAIEGNDGTSHRQVNLSNAYDVNGNALFDFLVVYGKHRSCENAQNYSVNNSDISKYISKRWDNSFHILYLGGGSSNKNVKSQPYADSSNYGKRTGIAFIAYSWCQRQT